MNSVQARLALLPFAAVVAVLTASVCPGVLCQTDLNDADMYKTGLNNVMSVLLKTVDFFGYNYPFVNVDAVFCMRLCQGSLLGILEDCETRELACPGELVRDISEVLDRLDGIARQANVYTEKQNPVRFSVFQQLMVDPFLVKYIPENITSIHQVSSQFNHYEGEQGDHCIVNLMGFRPAGGAVPRCTVSDKCRWFMTRDGSGHYYLTHQLLYLMIGEKVGCEDILGQEILETEGVTLRDMQRRLCGKIYDDIINLSQNGTVAPGAQDLFLEEIAFCGMLGFQNFFNESWIPLILDWQTPQGCFTTKDKRGHIQKWADEESTKFIVSQTVFEKAKHRWKRTEKLMPDGCLSHKTGVAIAAMGVYVRYLITQAYANV